ncbi:MAG: hypothetical protein V8T86_02250 [Victivallis sp.]
MGVRLHRRSQQVFLLQKYWERPIYPFLDEHVGKLLASFGNTLEAVRDTVPILNWKMSPTSLFLSGQEIFFSVSVPSALPPVPMSLLTCRRPFDFDRMLRHGRYNLGRRAAQDALPALKPGFPALANEAAPRAKIYARRPDTGLFRY